MGYDRNVHHGLNLIVPGGFNGFLVTPQERSSYYPYNTHETIGFRCVRRGFEGVGNEANPSY